MGKGHDGGQRGGLLEKSGRRLADHRPHSLRPGLRHAERPAIDLGLLRRACRFLSFPHGTNRHVPRLDRRREDLVMNDIGLGFAPAANSHSQNFLHGRPQDAPTSPVHRRMAELTPLHEAYHSSPRLPVLTETPWDAIGSIVKERVLVADRAFIIHRPDQSIQLLDHPTVQASFAADEYLPFWTDLSPSARILATVIGRESWTLSAPALEIAH